MAIKIQGTCGISNVRTNVLLAFIVYVTLCSIATKSGLFSSSSPILSLCCLLMCLSLWALRLHFWGQNGHWNWGSLPHSYVRCLCNESFLMYILPHCWQPKFPRILWPGRVGFLLETADQPNHGLIGSELSQSSSFSSILIGSSENCFR